jgi:hypothetical protein
MPDQQARDDQARPPQPLRARVLRAMLGLVLLLGPLLCVELFMREQVRWLRPVLRKYTYSLDMKLLFLAHRGACPDLVTLGTSLTDQDLPPKFLAGQRLGDDAIDDPFDFAAAEVRATNMLAQYRWLRRSGCKPEWIVVEVSPIAINGEHGGRTHDPALMSARAQLGMPDGFAELRNYTIAEQLELATYERLLIHRRREQIADRAINQLGAELWFMSEAERAEAPEVKPMLAPTNLEFDGKLTGLGKSLTKSSWAAEERKRRRFYEAGTYHWLNNDPEQQAITTLVREAAAEGVGVIIQAPPVTALYHAEMSPMLGIEPDFQAFSRELDALADELPNVVWYDAHTDPRYELADFTDWVHLSKRGAPRYVEALIDASNVALRAEQQAR